MNVLRILSRRQAGIGFWCRLGLAVLLANHATTLTHAAGTVKAWGDDSAAQLQIDGLVNVVAVAAGGNHSLALKSDGTVVGCGFDVFGQATPPAGLTNVTAISAGSIFSMALKSNGKVVAWGDNSYGQTNVPAGLANVVAIAAGWNHAMALKGDGTVVAWGDNTYGQTNVPSGLTNIVAVAAGSGTCLALGADGMVFAWGDGAYGKTTVPIGLRNVVAIAAGEQHCLALRGDGIVVPWGDNSAGQLNVPSTLTNAVAIAAGALHSLALRADGSLAAWGDNTYSQSVVNPSILGYFAISAGGSHSLAVRGTGYPVILTQPFSQVVFTAQSVTLRVKASGATPLLYQWLKNGTNILNATNSSLAIASAQLSDSGVYTVVVANYMGSVTSANANLTVLGGPPFFTSQPTNTSTYCGEGATFQATADGSKPFGFQWQFQGVPIDGATTAKLTLTGVTTNNAGPYEVVVTNIYGGVTSAVATLTVVVEPPFITSPLAVTAKQGSPFTYQIQGRHSPIAYAAMFLPAGLSIDTTNGVISGVPQQSGVYNSIITSINACAADNQVLQWTITPSIPAITSPTFASGTEGVLFTYQITATESPISFDVQNLPVGLTIDTATGLIEGQPAFPGDFYATVFASNIYGTGSTNVHFNFAGGTVTNLGIANITYNYSSPYLLDFQFSLRDSPDTNASHAVVADPRQLQITCLEDDQPISPSETGVIVQRGNLKVLKAYLVLDYTESISSIGLNGDTNNNGISDAVDTMVSAATLFVNQQPQDALIGVYEFHREDWAPSNVVSLITDKVKLKSAIAGIWTNYVKGYPAGSRCWDALYAAIGGLGASNRDEQHYVVFVSDGKDESSTHTTNDVVMAATNANVQIYCVGFGDEVDSNALQYITTQTKGNYYTAGTNLTDLAAGFAQIGKDINGQYALRWATLKRTGTAFMPSFIVTYQGFSATSPPNSWYTNFNDPNPPVDTNQTPNVTNWPVITNIIIDWYVPTKYAGPVTNGSLRLVSDADVHPTGVALRATYLPRYVTQMRLYYRPNWPCTVALASTNQGEALYGWSMSATNDTNGGTWLLLSSPNPANIGTSLPFAWFGKLLTFSFRDALPGTNDAFSALQIDNTIYSNQKFTFENTNLFVKVYPVLPYGTPVPWLNYYKFTGNLTNAEISDPDGDGMLTWQEYRANTVPTNAASKFYLQQVTQGSDGRFLITFSVSSNRTYRVDSSADLVNWNTVQDNIVPSPGSTNITVTDTNILIGVSNLFYRALVY